MQGLEYYVELARKIKDKLPNAKIIYGGKRKNNAWRHGLEILRCCIFR